MGRMGLDGITAGRDLGKDGTRILSYPDLENRAAIPRQSINSV